MKAFRNRKTLVIGIGAAVLAAGAAAFSMVDIFSGIGTAQTSVTPPAPAVFGTYVLIDPNPTAINGFFDHIQWVSEGRDERGAFASIGIWISPNNPYAGLLGTAPGSISSLASPWNRQPSLLFANTTAPDAGYLAAGYFSVELVYRPLNDPVNPGHTGLPGVATDVACDALTAHAVAQAFINCRNAAAGLGPGVVPILPTLELELDTGATATTGEFYKFRVLE